MFPIQRGVTTATEPKATEQEETLEDGRNVTVIYNRDAGTQMIQHQDSVTDYCSMSSQCSLEPPGSDGTSTSDLGSPVSRSSSPPADQQDASRNPHHKDLVYQDPQQDSEDLPSPQLKAFTVLSVNRTLWIPRYTIGHTTVMVCS